jgi:Type II secretion system (T2SS), protein G
MNLRAAKYPILIVLALAAIWLVMSLYEEYQIIGTVQSARAEQRNIAIMLKSVRVHEGRFPTQDEYYDNSKNQDRLRVFNVVNPATTWDRYKYVEALPGDPFREPSRKYHYIYEADIYNFWILASVGPDGVRDLVAGDYVYDATDGGRFTTQGLSHIYDPPNGVKSSGDIIKTGP